MTANRYGRTVRWVSVLQQELGSDYLIIEEGYVVKTTVWDDPIEGFKNGKEYLPPCLVSHKPLDLVIIMLGTNDLKKRFSLSAYDIAGDGVLVDIVKKATPARMGVRPSIVAGAAALSPIDRTGRNGGEPKKSAPVGPTLSAGG
ncbi:MAG: hypothetical protein U0401_27940 [Anaerolineae bacterium]